MALLYRFENLQRHKLAKGGPTADLPVLDPDADLHCENRANEPWVGLKLVFAWSLAALIGWGVLAGAAWALIFGIHGLWSVTP